MQYTAFKCLLNSIRSSKKSKTTFSLIAICAVVVTTAVVNTLAASSGALDLSFGSRGTAAFNPAIRFKDARAVAVQPDGKVLLAGFIRNCTVNPCHDDIIVIRFNANGTLDTSFGTGGSVTTDYSAQNEAASDIAVQSDGKIVVVGGWLSGQVSDPSQVLGFKVVRYNTDGTLDSSFGVGGKAYEPLDEISGKPESMVIQADGKIVISGSDGSSKLFVARFNTNGSLDTNFAGGRVASTTYGVSATEIAMQADGKVVVAGGTSTPTVKVIRFNTNGTPDGDFGTGGVAALTFEDSLNPALGIQPDGKIIVSGDYYNQDRRVPPLKRLNADGTNDAGFVPNHGVITNGYCRDCTQDVVSVLPLPDGRFYLAGYYAPLNSVPAYMSVSRYLSNGSIDLSFGFRGTSIFRHTNKNTSQATLWFVNDAALQADGKVVMAATGDPVNYTTPEGASFLAVRINAEITRPGVRGDFDGDRKTDFAVFRPSTRFWYASNSSDGSMLSSRFGADGDILAPSDYNYDLKTDLAVVRPSQSNYWHVAASAPSFGGNPGGAFGQAGDINVPEDYDGDGYADMATFRPADGTWRIHYSSTRPFPFGIAQINEASLQFGLGTDKPVPADYDGDGKADLAVFRPSNGYWYMLRSSDAGFTAVQFGIATDKLVQSDYDNDGKADVAVYRDGNWYVLRSSDGGFVAAQFGTATDKPVPGDYDGDGKYDYAVYRPAEGNWYVLKSSDGSYFGQQWGISEDTPIPFTLVR